MTDTLHLIHPDLRSLAVPIGDLHEDPDNANTHDDLNLTTIADSFIEFGQRKPLVVRREGMIVEAGNGQLASLRAAGWTHLACVVCDDDETRAKAFALVDNQAGRLSKWNFEQLRVNAEALLAADFNVQSLGWSSDDLADILSGRAEELAAQVGGANEEPEPPQPPSNEPDDSEEPPIPEPPAEPITQSGDVIELGPHVLHCADCLDVMRGLPDNSIDAIITDPPYGLSPDGRARTWDDIEALRAEGKGPTAGFMGRAWDAGVPGITWARECLRVLKPGGYLVAFSATRTVHRLTCAVEDAGFEIRDQLGWIQYQGFPKSNDFSQDIDVLFGAERSVVSERPAYGIGNNGSGKFNGHSEGAVARVTAPSTDAAKRWAGFGTALKPASEPACIARKPLDNIAPEEAADLLGQDHIWSRKALDTDKKRESVRERWGDVPEGAIEWRARPLRPNVEGRFELRVDGEVVATCAGSKFSSAPLRTVALNVLKWGTGGINIDAGRHAFGDPAWPGPSERWADGDPSAAPTPDGAAWGGVLNSRMSQSHDLGRWPANIYATPKPSTSEREAGTDGDGSHPTVKPRKLMAQVIDLFCPPGGTILEPFGGSGTTAVAAKGRDCKVIIAEREPGYCDIIRPRVLHSLT